MNDLNHCCFIGRVTKDVDLNYTKSGVPFAKFSIAVNRKRKDREDVSFLNIVIWNKIAENLSQYLTKGKQVCVSCEAVQNRWEGESGSQSRIEFTAYSIQLLGGSGGEPFNRSQPRFKAPPQSDVGVEDFIDDVPF